jgi:S1-C subfamily serine protease
MGLVMSMRVRLLGGLTLLALLAGCQMPSSPDASKAAPGASATGPSARPAGPLLDPARGVLTMAPLVAGVTLGVVNIAVRSRVERAPNPLFDDPFFRRFFDLPAVPREREVLSAGSGVIVDAARGYILTNGHVVANPAEIQVTLKDRRTYPARLVGSDPATDVALLQIDAPGLTAVAFGDSDRLEVGDVVVAIGNPFGLGQTVTSGIVSTLGRSGLGLEGYEDFIQTDASINPGNSGGALVNSKGELVGINTAIIGPTGGNIGIGFAVPANMAKAVMAQLVEHGEVRRGRLGITIECGDHPCRAGLPRRARGNRAGRRDRARARAADPGCGRSAQSGRAPAGRNRPADRAVSRRSRACPRRAHRPVSGSRPHRSEPAAPI